MLRRLLAKPKKKAPSRKPAVRAKVPKRPAAKKTGAKKTPKARSKKPGDEELGRVVGFFRLPVVAVIRVTRGSLKTGDLIWIRGHTTDLKMAIASMQVDHQPVAQIGKGKEAGVKVPSRVRRGDRVYRIA